MIEFTVIFSYSIHAPLAIVPSIVRIDTWLHSTIAMLKFYMLDSSIFIKIVSNNADRRGYWVLLCNSFYVILVSNATQCNIVLNGHKVRG